MKVEIFPYKKARERKHGEGKYSPYVATLIKQF